ncbi:hypothetical protein, partial [Streptomyces albogriseolus]|uniref:hypothetical protein n=1 Tax=Streptomyces albogriseolus TaxID=1887 RepID=UPI0036C2BBDC
MSPIPRRTLIKAAAVAGAATQAGWTLGARDAAAPATGPAGADPVTLDWLEECGLGAAPGSTGGVHSPRGAHP